VPENGGYSANPRAKPFSPTWRGRGRDWPWKLNKPWDLGSDHLGSASRMRRVHGVCIANNSSFFTRRAQGLSPMTRTQNGVQFRTFTSYAQHHAAAKNKALGSIEQQGAAAALDRCRELAEEICEKLKAKKPGRLDTRALAEFQVALERAASVRLLDV